jgi:hypothetical protein
MVSWWKLYDLFFTFPFHSGNLCTVESKHVKVFLKVKQYV